MITRAKQAVTGEPKSRSGQPIKEPDVFERLASQWIHDAPGWTSVMDPEQFQKEFEGDVASLGALLKRVASGEFGRSEGTESDENKAFRAGWDDAVEHVFQVLGERFSRRAGRPSDSVCTDVAQNQQAVASISPKIGVPVDDPDDRRVLLDSRSPMADRSQESAPERVECVNCGQTPEEADPRKDCELGSGHGHHFVKWHPRDFASPAIEDAWNRAWDNAGAKAQRPSEAMLNPGARVRLVGVPDSLGTVDGWCGPSSVTVQWDGGHRNVIMAAALERAPEEPVPQRGAVWDGQHWRCGECRFQAAGNHGEGCSLRPLTNEPLPKGHPSRDIREVLMEQPLPRTIAARPIPPERLRGIIEFARKTWRDDGAEGEAVHRLCDALEQRDERLLKLLIQRVGGRVGFTEHDLRRADRFQLRKVDDGHATTIVAVDDT